MKGDWEHDIKPLVSFLSSFSADGERLRYPLLDKAARRQHVETRVVIDEFRVIIMVLYMLMGSAAEACHRHVGLYISIPLYND